METGIPPAIQSLDDAARILRDIAAKLDSARVANVAQMAAAEIENASPFAEITTSDLAGHARPEREPEPEPVAEPLLGSLASDLVAPEAPASDGSSAVAIAADRRPPPMAGSADGIPRNVARRMGSWLHSELDKMSTAEGAPEAGSTPIDLGTEPERKE